MNNIIYIYLPEEAALEADQQASADLRGGNIGIYVLIFILTDMYVKDFFYIIYTQKIQA